eukprot:12888326-Prorocentrum_lima.AAC.1
MGRGPGGTEVPDVSAERLVLHSVGRCTAPGSGGGRAQRLVGFHRVRERKEVLSTGMSEDVLSGKSGGPNA